MLVASGIGTSRATCGHAVDAGRGVFEIFEDAVEFAADVDRGLDGPGGVRVQPQWMRRERLAQRPDRGDLLIGRQDAALELDRAEAVLGDEAPGLLDDGRGVQRGAPAVRLLAQGARPTCRTGTR